MRTVGWLSRPLALQPRAVETKENLESSTIQRMCYTWLGPRPSTASAAGEQAGSESEPHTLTHAPHFFVEELGEIYP